MNSRLAIFICFALHFSAAISQLQSICGCCIGKFLSHFHGLLISIQESLPFANPSSDLFINFYCPNLNWFPFIHSLSDCPLCICEWSTFLISQKFLRKMSLLMRWSDQFQLIYCPLGGRSDKLSAAAGSG